MPVTLETIDATAEQDLIDLQKIYEDYPTALRWPELNATLNTQPDNAQTKLYAARFNARLLGSISCQLSHNGNALLDHLCVRKVTRQRHVARDLLRLLLQELKSNNVKQVTLQCCIDSEGLSKTLLQAGFTQQDQLFTLQLT